MISINVLMISVATGLASLLTIAGLLAGTFVLVASAEAVIVTAMTKAKSIFYLVRCK